MYINPFWHHPAIQLLPNILLLTVFCSNSENPFSLNAIINDLIMTTIFKIK